MKKGLILITAVWVLITLASCSNMLEDLEKASHKPKLANYTVEHWQQNTEGEEYTKVETDTQTLEGKIGEQTQAVAKEYNGFHTRDEAVTQKTITRDGKTTVSIYYDREIIEYTLNEKVATRLTVKKAKILNKLR